MRLIEHAILALDSVLAPLAVEAQPAPRVDMLIPISRADAASERDPACGLVQLTKEAVELTVVCPLSGGPRGGCRARPDEARAAELTSPRSSTNWRPVVGRTAQ
jgi:hypothetical protein